MSSLPLSTGPWRRYWYVSDGGFFDNTGMYELIRRRVPCIVGCDASEDPQGQLNALGNLLRKARTDFDADIRFLTTAQIASLSLPPTVKPLSEKLMKCALRTGTFHRKHAALARIYYDGADQPSGLLLYIKSGVTGDEPVDVLNYRAEHSKFPPRANQRAVLQRSAVGKLSQAG